MNNTRRAIFLGAATLASAIAAGTLATPAIGAPQINDTELVAIAAEFAALAPMEAHRAAASNEATKRAREIWAPKWADLKSRGVVDEREFEKVLAEAEIQCDLYAEAYDWESLMDRMSDLVDRANAIRATTLTGLQAKAAMTVVWHSRFAEPDGVEVSAVNALCADILAMGA